MHVLIGCRLRINLAFNTAQTRNAECQTPLPHLHPSPLTSAAAAAAATPSLSTGTRRSRSGPLEVDVDVGVNDWSGPTHLDPCKMQERVFNLKDIRESIDVGRPEVKCVSMNVLIMVIDDKCAELDEVFHLVAAVTADLFNMFEVPNSAD